MIARLLMLTLLTCAPAAAQERAAWPTPFQSSALDVPIALEGTPSLPQAQEVACGPAFWWGAALGVVLGAGFVWWQSSGGYEQPASTADYVFLPGVGGLVIGGTAWSLCLSGR